MLRYTYIVCLVCFSKTTANHELAWSLDNRVSLWWTKDYSVCLFWRNYGGKFFSVVWSVSSWLWSVSTHNDGSFPLPVGITAGNRFDVPCVVRILQYAVTMRHYFGTKRWQLVALTCLAWPCAGYLKRFRYVVNCVLFMSCVHHSRVRRCEACAQTGLCWCTFE
jgi:hypothetical protein